MTTATKATHTPGPWTSQEEDGILGPRIVISGAANARGDVRIIASLLLAAERPKPDARLIAASPDLLAALIKLRRRVHVIDELNPLHDTDLVEADAAIAKAVPNG